MGNIMQAILYEKDFYAWTQEQIKLIKDKFFNKIDYQHLEEELQAMGASEKRELGSRLEVLLMHLLKWKYQPAYRSGSWSDLIEEQRDKIKDHLADNPSLKTKMHDTMVKSYKYAIRGASKETGMSKGTFPHVCEWSIKQVLDDEFFPS